MVDCITVKSNGHFSILEEPISHKQHPNQQEGLDLYVKVVNHYTSEVCFKKLYSNTKGLYFKHSMKPSTHYLDDFTKNFNYIPFHINEVK